MRDMRDVGCRDPTVLTRVSEYMDVIVEYIEKIMANGFAYAANGSVYFDTQAFRRAPGCAAMHARACRARVGCVQGSEAVKGAPAARWNTCIRAAAGECRPEFCGNNSPASCRLEACTCVASALHSAHAQRARPRRSPRGCDARQAARAARLTRGSARPGRRATRTASCAPGRSARRRWRARARRTLRRARSAAAATSRSGRPPSRASRAGRRPGAPGAPVRRPARRAPVPLGLRARAGLAHASHARAGACQTWRRR